jgi:hypothetical protein
MRREILGLDELVVDDGGDDVTDDAGGGGGVRGSDDSVDKRAGI